MNVVLHYNELFAALCMAVGNFMQEAHNDPALSARLEEAASRHYARIPSSAIDWDAVRAAGLNLGATT